MSNTYYSQGIYPLKNSHKYKGSVPVCYRSKPEYLLMRWLDLKDCILEWSSESIIIPYIKPTDGKVHRYFVDFSCKFKNPDGSVTKYLLEYKPYKQTLPPTQSSRKSHRTILFEKEAWQVNQSKWHFAEKWANENGYKFLVITEKDLN
jgi:hypothetical protein